MVEQIWRYVGSGAYPGSGVNLAVVHIDSVRLLFRTELLSTLFDILKDSSSYDRSVPDVDLYHHFYRLRHQSRWLLNEGISLGLKLLQKHSRRCFKL
jgi:hypothetical protein